MIRDWKFEIGMLGKYEQEVGSMKHAAAIAKGQVLLVLVTLVFFIPLLHAEDFFFDSAGVKIHYTVEGKGEPVLLIHGFGGDIQDQWGAPGVIKALSDAFQVIAIDNRGHGKSDKPHDRNAYGINMVEDPIRLLDHLKIAKAHVVGYSMGGRITGAMIALHPERLQTAVLGGAGWNPPGQDDIGLSILADSLEQGKGIGPLVQALTPVGAKPPTPEEVDMANKYFLAKNDAMALAAVIRNFPASPTEAQIRANKVPVLALIGELDPMKSGVDRLNGLMPNLKIVVIPKANHITAFADPEFIKSLKSFLIEHSAGGSKQGLNR
jgi:pimeloyl-ACP methyl ester carboxylesterase